MTVLYTVALLAVFAVASLYSVRPAFAASIEELSDSYQSAVQGYQDILSEQSGNFQSLSSLESQIAAKGREIDEAQSRIGSTAVAYYKNTRNLSSFTEILLSSSNLQDAIKRIDYYSRIERYCAQQMGDLEREQAQLEYQRSQLEYRKQDLERQLSEAKQAIDDAEAALRDAIHEDGKIYHQVQGNSSNCGATSFIVGVNILLHENRFTDNVEVWESDAFDRDSTRDLDLKGRVWLAENKLFDEISITEKPGDIHTVRELAEELEEGHVVIISSGAGSIWQRADGTQADEGSFPDGHWIVFYHYENGVFYADDSSVSAAKGAGVAYTEEQMQQWLDGRANHFATIMKKK